jgi:hypothetical protein
MGAEILRYAQNDRSFGTVRNCDLAILLLERGQTMREKKTK